ncbi:MAG: radical SAM protein, partial [Desulfobacterales bacterium]|nr:radical SAM protein [Desulfobacterales bacterium]
RARALSWKHCGRRIRFYLPGIFVCDGVTGKYPALSITGKRCALQCDHCRGVILQSMIATPTPAVLVETCRRLSRKGVCGVLLSGGCDEHGRLPWGKFLSAIREIKRSTGLFVSVHSGLVAESEAANLKAAGVDQALIDVIGDDDTLQRIYHVPFGVSEIRLSLGALQRAGLPIVPHIVCGLNYGKMQAEQAAVDMIADFAVEQIVIVSLMPIPGTPVAHCNPPPAEEVAELIAYARYQMPSTRISMGCARQRGNPRLELLAIDAGVNRLALPSDEALARAQSYGLDITYQRTCCSVSIERTDDPW